MRRKLLSHPYRNSRESKSRHPCRSCSECSLDDKNVRRMLTVLGVLFTVSALAMELAGYASIGGGRERREVKDLQDPSQRSEVEPVRKKEKEKGVEKEIALKKDYVWTYRKLPDESSANGNNDNSGERGLKLDNITVSLNLNGEPLTLFQFPYSGNYNISFKFIAGSTTRNIDAAFNEDLLTVVLDVNSIILEQRSFLESVLEVRWNERFLMNGTRVRLAYRYPSKVETPCLNSVPKTVVIKVFYLVTVVIPNLTTGPCRES